MGEGEPSPFRLAPQGLAAAVEAQRLSQENADEYGLLADLIGLAGIALLEGDEKRAAALLVAVEYLWVIKTD